MKYMVKYSDLLLNTMLDTIKRENRRTIDSVDIMNFEKIVKSIAKQYNLYIGIESIDNDGKFIDEIDSYIIMSKENADVSYTLLPWIDEKELEDRVANTIYTDMSYVYQVTSKELTLSRKAQDVNNLRMIDKIINFNFLKSTQNNLIRLEDAKQKEMEKLVKIKQNLGMSD